MENKENAVSARAARSLEIRTTPDDCMIEVLHKLHLLDYRSGFYGSKFGKHRPLLDRYFFTGPRSGRSQSEQLFCFINLASWLLAQYGNAKLEPVKEGGDTQAAVNGVLQALKQLQFEIPQPKDSLAKQLSTGSGAAVLGVLDALADWALESSSFSFEKAVPDAEGGEGDFEMAEVHEEADMLVDGAMPQANAHAGGDDDLDFLAPSKTQDAQATEEAGDNNIIENTIDREAWDLEYQQVAPRLQIRVAAEARDWHTHLDAATEQLKRAFPAHSSAEGRAGSAAEAPSTTAADNDASWLVTKRQLQHIHSYLEEQLNKVESREQFLNGEFATRTDEYRNKKELFAQRQIEYRQYLSQVSEGAAELQRYIDLIDEMSAEVEDRSSNKAGTAGPLGRARGAISSLKSEMSAMDVKLGVCRQQLLRMKLTSHAEVA